MKSLMPLTLSPSPSYTSLWSTASLDQPALERVDDYFPELLARDLQRSAAAAIPKAYADSSPCPDIKGRQRPASPRHECARAQSLDGLQECAAKLARVSFADRVKHDLRADDTQSSDVESQSTAQTSLGTAPSLERHESGLTATTSSLSVKWDGAQARLPSTGTGLYDSSWIDAESDYGSDDEEPTPARGHTGCPRALSLTSLPPGPPQQPGCRPSGQGILGRRSHSVSGSEPVFVHHLADTAQDTRPRPASAHGLASCTQAPMSPPPRTSSQSRSPPVTSCITPGSSRKSCRVLLSSPQSSSNYGSDTSDMHDTLLDKPVPAASPKAPPANAWLSYALSPYPRWLQNDEMAKVVPLPPEAMETLRVSVACFPETMLLSSSLTIETIRTYSHKVRQPSLDLLSNTPLRNQAPDSSPLGSRRSIWRKVVPSKRIGLLPAPILRRNFLSSHQSIDSVSSPALVSARPWEPLKSVFGYCSDYICDALYAHIVAFNYISTLVTRSPAPSPSPCQSPSLPPPGPPLPQPTQTRNPGPTTPISPGENIPKKAASLLGLASASDAAAAGLNRLTQRIATPLGTLPRPDVAPNQSQAALVTHENLLSGLMRCISQLMATAKLMSENGGGEDIVKTEPGQVDFLLVRCLCEIVRMSEDC
ncbi:hypothetical protein CDD82_6925 [Ophiocordyceps australis]|uniref:Uncharacterized protein n=1 Tax=Ophiocordyceps australis TaxID=1399860 RepID=A0A2C5YV43_9HYPO|nr:hypothetical protein CDD82_6925 [Ophiocordyceps australis]